MPIILGADKSGKSLLAGMLNCSPDVDHESLFTALCRYRLFEKFGTELLDNLHSEFNSDEKFIWLIRNPLESSCSIHKAGISHEEALSYWVDVNTIIWYFLHSVPEERKMCVRFEELLLNDSKIRSIFDFSGIIFNEQYLRYGDFDQFSFSDPTFLKGVRDGEKVDFYKHGEELCRHWNEVKNKKIVMQFGYTRSTLWDQWYLKGLPI